VAVQWDGITGIAPIGESTMDEDELEGMDELEKLKYRFRDARRLSASGPSA
jgi:hypothetical protein